MVRVVYRNRIRHFVSVSSRKSNQYSALSLRPWHAWQQVRLKFAIRLKVYIQQGLLHHDCPWKPGPTVSFRTSTNQISMNNFVYQMGTILYPEHMCFERATVVATIFHLCCIWWLARLVCLRDVYRHCWIAQYQAWTKEMLANERSTSHRISMGPMPNRDQSRTGK